VSKRKRIRGPEYPVSILADGLDFVLDMDRSTGSHLVDARTGERYLDMFTFFASSALGMNHPALADDEAFRAELAQAAVELTQGSVRTSNRISSQYRI
jgi:L-lysine 6-transaminase